MKKLPKGTLNEKINATKNIEITKEDTIKVEPPKPDVTDAPDASTEVPTIVKEPAAAEPKPEPKREKEPCTLCKVKSIANVAFSFSLVLLVLAFSFSLVKTDK